MYTGPINASTPLRRAITAQWVVLIGVAVATWACSSDQGSGPKPRSGLHIVSGVGLSDTIGAYVANPVVAELRDSAGAPIVGAPLVFSIPPQPSGTTRLFAFPAIYQPIGGSIAVTDTTDSDGRVSVWFAFGPTAGPLTLRVVDNARALEDSTTITIRPGHPAKLLIEPQDTSLLVGNSFAPRFSVVDGGGNPTSPTPAFTLTTTGSAITQSRAGVISGSAIGRAMYVAYYGVKPETAFVSVVPDGVLALYAVDFEAKAPLGIYLLHTDGSQGRWAYKLDKPDFLLANFTIGLWPAWSPDGSQIAFVEQDTLLRVQATGGAPTALTTSVLGDFGPEYSADGQWIYFTHVAGAAECWRIHPDGTGLSRVTSGVNGVEQAPSPSPAGDLIAYQTTPPPGAGPSLTIALAETATGAVTNLNVPGLLPKWSPKGDQIAFLSSAASPDLALMTPTGGQVVRITPRQDPAGGISWSPKGDWIVYGASTNSGAATLNLLQVSTGLILPLKFTGPDGQYLYNAAWMRSQ